MKFRMSRRLVLAKRGSAARVEVGLSIGSGELRRACSRICSIAGRGRAASSRSRSIAIELAGPRGDRPVRRLELACALRYSRSASSSWPAASNCAAARRRASPAAASIARSSAILYSG